SAPFYTSEKLDLHCNVLWAEIDCPATIKSSLRSVCVRVWEHTARPGQPARTKQTDRLLFAWGVYFSGLVPLARRNEKRLRPNTLVFQLHGGYFTSAACILEPEERRPPVVNLPVEAGGATKTELVPKPNASSGQSSPFSPSATIPIVGAGVGARRGGGGSRFDKLSVSPVASNGGSSGGVLPHVARSTSPSSPLSWTEPFETSLKLRYLVMEFLPPEVRASYDVPRLLAIQERQRRIRYEADSVKTLIERICMKSAYCLNMELFASKHLVYRTGANQHRTGGMGKQLSRLLYQEREPIDPMVLLRGQELRRHIERARFRCRLLEQERDRMCGGMQQLRNRLNAACDSNIERESALMERYRTYGREKEQLYQQKMAYASQKDSVREVCAKMLMVRHQLLKGLNEIYYIKSTSQGIYTINDVPLPNAESYTDATPALALSVALGFVAHAVMMCSSFLDIPLRNPIKYDGSRSKIVDQIKLLPTMDRDFPLHCRSGPAPNALLYGVYLLNQNISQLKHQLSLSRGDPRATLVNLQDILTIPGIGGPLQKRDLEEAFQMLPSSVFGASS
ncbi:AGAP007772-PA, partial [Anopheles gambiae str. PEST]